MLGILYPTTYKRQLMSGQVYHHPNVLDRNDAILNTFEKDFGQVNTIARIEKVDNFSQLVLPIGVRIIEIDPDIGTQLSLEFQVLFNLHKMRS